MEKAAEDARREIEALHGKAWTTSEAMQEFEFLGFLAPFASVRRKSDGAEGTLQFTHSPRFYFGFQENG